MSRGGYSLLVVLVCLGVATSLTVAMLMASGSRRIGFQHRQQRIQAREYALGARALAPGSEVRVDGWRISRAADGACRAERDGLAWSIAADGSERVEGR